MACRRRVFQRMACRRRVYRKMACLRRACRKMACRKMACWKMACRKWICRRAACPTWAGPAPGKSDRGSPPSGDGHRCGRCCCGDGVRRNHNPAAGCPPRSRNGKGVEGCSQKTPPVYWKLRCKCCAARRPLPGTKFPGRRFTMQNESCCLTCGESCRQYSTNFPKRKPPLF